MTIATQRTYTMGDIDRMRKAIDWNIIPEGQPYYPAEKNAQVEDRLRTYMLAGVSPEEVEQKYVRQQQN